MNQNKKEARLEETIQKQVRKAIQKWIEKNILKTTQRRNMSNLEQLTHYAVTIKNKDIAFERNLIDREEAGKIIEGIEENHKKELERKDNEIKQLKEKLEKTETSLQKEQDTLEQERSKYESEKKEWEMAKNKLKNSIKGLEDKVDTLTKKIDTLTKTLDSKDNQLKQEEKAHNDTKKAAVNKVETLKEELQGLQRDAKKDLYTLYKQICPEKDNYGIQGENLYTFLITSGQVETLENLVESAKQSAINNPEQFSKEKEFFNQLFDSMQGCYNLERIVAKVGDNYDENYYKVEGDSMGKISEVILDGFKKNGNTRKKPLVKVKK